MRITTLLIGIQACFTSILIAGTTNAQTVNLDVQQVNVKQVFANIEKQTNVTFIYNEKTISGLSAISIKASNKPLADVLKSISEQVPLQFKQAGNVIGVLKKDLKLKIAEQINENENLLAPIKITGKVIDDNGQPLPGVSVHATAGHETAVSDINGNYAITIENESYHIIFTYIGYRTQEVIVGDRRILNITMSPDFSKLDEVQVIAYGTTTQRLNTGNTSKINSEIIEDQPVSNPLAALEGEVAGLSVTQKNGIAGSGFTVRIRGQNSIAAGNDPLYIVDGVPYFSTAVSTSNLGIVLNGSSPLNFINPSDIESIEVLKDADATAIYGSRGANGVILITTKKGKIGKTSVDANIYDGASKITRMMDLLNTQQYLQVRHEAFKNDGKTPATSDYDINGTWDTTRYTNWQKLLIGNTGHTQDAQLSFSGGSTNTQFYLGGGYRRETTVFPGTFADEKGSIHFNLTHTSENQKLRIIFSGSYVNDVNNLLNADLTNQALTLPPDAPATYDANGNLNWANGTFQNPLSGLIQTYKMSTDNLVSNALISYEIIKGLQVKASLGYNNIQINEVREFPIAGYNPAINLTTGSASFANTTVNSWIIEPQATYEKVLGKSKLNALIGTTFQQNLTNGQLYNGSGYTNDNLLGTISAASAITSSAPNYTQYRYQATFARINYKWEDKYIFDLTGRRDGSSRFGPGKEFANFGALGVAWIFSEEKFFKEDLPFISYGKLRSSYGITGNDQIADYGYINTYGSTTYPYSGSSGLAPTKLLNPDYSWEINKKFEVGIELGFLQDRILLTSSYYDNHSSNELVGYALPSITGFTTIQYNLPATIKNTGLEFDIKTTNVKSKDFKWSSSLNLTIPRNELLAYPNLAGSSYANTYVIGQSLYIHKVYQDIGVNPQTGVYQFIDVNGDGKISSPFDNNQIEQLSQNFYGGMGNSFSYKSFQLTFLFQFVKQTGLSYLDGPFSVPGAKSNEPTIVLDRWQQPGQVTNIQAFTQNSGSLAYAAYTNYQNSTGLITDASFIRLKNLSFSYSLSKLIDEHLHIQNCRFYIQGQNLLTFTNYLGLDPENQLGLPPLKSITVGIQVTL